MREPIERSIRDGSDPRKLRELDLQVCARMRERRIMLGLTQTELARRIGVTVQQLHKYERGINRVAAGQLFKLAAALNVHLGYFYEGLDKLGTQSQSPRLLLDLTRAFLAIPDPKQRDALYELARTLADTEPTEAEQSSSRIEQGNIKHPAPLQQAHERVW